MQLARFSVFPSPHLLPIFSLIGDAKVLDTCEDGEDFPPLDHKPQLNKNE
jgi:hypothetical protein